MLQVKKAFSKTHRTDNLTRIFSIVADCPSDVKSMMTSQRASGNGVNCPCTVGVTMQSSISPESRKKENEILCLKHYLCIM